MIAACLNKLGLIGGFPSSSESGVATLGVSWVVAAAILTLVYLYIHYFFASTTAHITAMFAAFYAVGLSLGGTAHALRINFSRCWQHYDDPDALCHRHRTRDI